MKYESTQYQEKFKLSQEDTFALIYRAISQCGKMQTFDKESGTFQFRTTPSGICNQVDFSVKLSQYGENETIMYLSGHCAGGLDIFNAVERMHNKFLECISQNYGRTFPLDTTTTGSDHHVNTSLKGMARMVLCKTCGKDIAYTASVCPHCGAKQKQGVLALCAVIGVLTVFACIAIIIFALNGESSSHSKSGGANLIYEDKILSASFISTLDANSLGGFYLNLQMKNTGTSKIMVTLSNTYVNDMAVTSLTGVPVVIEPGKGTTAAYFMSYGSQTVSSLDDIDHIQLSFFILDNDTLAVIEETNTVTLTF